MLPLVVFALLFGFALTRVEEGRSRRLLELFQSIADTMIVIVRWVLWLAPVGVFALVLVVCASVGGSILGLLGAYVGMQCAVYLGIIAMLYLVAFAGGGESIRRFAASILPAQVIAASTQSSLASLPAMLESANTRLGYPRAVTGLVLPMAVSLFRITSPAQYLGVASFIAWAYGVDLPSCSSRPAPARGRDQPRLGRPAGPGELHGDEPARRASDGPADRPARAAARRRHDSRRGRDGRQRHRRPDRDGRGGGRTGPGPA